MIKQLKQWGNGLAIYFDSNEIETYGMKLGDKIDLSDMFLTQVSIKKVNNMYKKLPKNQTKEMIKKEVSK